MTWCDKHYDNRWLDVTSIITTGDCLVLSRCDLFHCISRSHQRSQWWQCFRWLFIPRVQNSFWKHLSLLHVQNGFWKHLSPLLVRNDFENTSSPLVSEHNMIFVLKYFSTWQKYNVFFLATTVHLNYIPVDD